MAKFIVHVTETVLAVYEVEADSPEEALDLVDEGEHREEVECNHRCDPEIEFTGIENADTGEVYDMDELAPTK